jgi:hypothetical protein
MYTETVTFATVLVIPDTILVESTKLRSVAIQFNHRWTQMNTDDSGPQAGLFGRHGHSRFGDDAASEKESFPLVLSGRNPGGMTCLVSNRPRLILGRKRW